MGEIMKRKITHRALLIGLLCVILAAGPGVQAQTQQARQVTLIQDMAPVGISFGQTVRYTVAFILKQPRGSNPNDPNPQGHEFEPTSIRVRLVAADGSVIAEKEATAVGAGQFQSFDFNRDQIRLPEELGTGRLQARLEVTLRGTSVTIIDRPGVPASDSALKTFVDAVEIIDNATGRTTVSKGGGFNWIILNDSPGKEIF
jgi:hypothetical protein